ncbi:tetratricopeptide repeat protein [Clostridium sp. BL-8]|uniref:tetratricopeptide repeat protein n=1 Tax=Clostridium sp. BL-8 TaxID=349938 RepID=UPI00098CAC2A|nr:tetratricopeptide repeat protein [Clostridium sp. BL-8]OOM76404.1 outer membrane protein assembly factor BamD [Clostridium sp. BL-8]
MEKKSRKTYDKAMNYYEQGRIDKALELCEEILSEGLDNPLVLNFKGLLLYQMGNLSDAVTVWKINTDLNNDDIARSYIEDSITDENRLELYKRGEEALEQFKVDKALELFKICAESDFNLIKVNIAIAMCYQKKGEFIKAKEYLDKALSVDKNEVTAKIIGKELKDDGIDMNSGGFPKSIIIGIMIFFILIISVGGYLFISKYKNRNSFGIVQEDKPSIALEENNEKDTQNEQNIVDSAKSEPDTNFDREKLNILIAGNDFDGLYEQLRNVEKESLSTDDMDVYNKAVHLIRDKGIGKFYEDGLSSFNQGNYSAAKVSFDKAYTYCEGSSIKEHILFYRGSTSYNLSDNESAIAQLEEYYKQYPKGVYTEEALYELALISNSIDKEKSKVYANKLMTDFPNSIYVNDKIRDILKN